MNRTFFSACGVALCLNLLGISPTDAADKVSIAAAFGTIWTAAQPTFCKDRGEFAKANLDVDVVTTRGGSETVQAVISGGLTSAMGLARMLSSPQ